MLSKVNWFYTEEEFCIGFARITTGDVFITEEIVRFGATKVHVANTVHDCVLRKWLWTMKDYLNADEEDRGRFDKEYEEIVLMYEKASKEE